MSEQVNTADGQDEIQHMDYIYMVNDNKLIIRMNAELDHHLAEEMRQVIDDVIDKRGVTHIVFDFTKVDFMDSAGSKMYMHFRHGSLRPQQARIQTADKRVDRSYLQIRGAGFTKKIKIGKITLSKTKLILFFLHLHS